MLHIMVILHRYALRTAYTVAPIDRNESNGHIVQGTNPRQRDDLLLLLLLMCWLLHLLLFIINILILLHIHIGIFITVQYDGSGVSRCI